MKRSRMERILNNTTERDLPHIFIPSYNRPDFVTGRSYYPTLQTKLWRGFILWLEKNSISSIKEKTAA